MATTTSADARSSVPESLWEIMMLLSLDIPSLSVFQSLMNVRKPCYGSRLMIWICSINVSIWMRLPEEKAMPGKDKPEREADLGVRTV